MSARLFQYVAHRSRLARRSEDDLVYKLLAGVVKKGLERSDDVTRIEEGPRHGFLGIDKALEGVPKVSNAFQVVPKRLRFGSRPHNDHIPCIDAAVKSSIKQSPIDCSPKTQYDGYKPKREDDDASRDVRSVQQIEGSSQQESCREASLNAQTLFVKKAAQAGRIIEVHSLAGCDQCEREAAKKCKENPH